MGLGPVVSTFGLWTSPRKIEKAIIDHCVKWGETFIAEAERQFGIPARSIPVPEEGQYTTVRDTFEKWPEDQTPAVLVISPGVSSSARREADRSLTAPVGIALGVIASSGFEGAGAETAQIIGVALRELLTSWVPIEGLDLAQPVELVVEGYGDIPAGGERTMGSSRIGLVFWVKNWAAIGGGPLDRTTPPDDPYAAPAEAPTVQKLFWKINDVEGGTG